MYFSSSVLSPSALLLLFFLFSAFLSCVNAHSWIEAVTHVRDNKPFGEIGYARGNGLQSLNVQSLAFTQKWSQFYARKRASTTE